MTSPKPTDSEQLIQQRIDTALAESKKGNSEDDIAQLLWLAQGIDIWHRTNGSRGHSLEDAMRYLASSIVRRDYERNQQRLSAVLEAIEQYKHGLVAQLKQPEEDYVRARMNIIDNEAARLQPPTAGEGESV